MKISRTKYLTWISLFFLAFSCRTPEVLIFTDLSGITQDSPIKANYEKKTLKATVNYQGRELTGRILIKMLPSGETRVSFYSELGMTYLEGAIPADLRKKKLIIHTIIPVLDKKPFIRSFQKSLEPELE